MLTLIIGNTSRLKPTGVIAIILPQPANMLGHVADLDYEQVIQLNQLFKKNQTIILHCSYIWLAIICMQYTEHSVHTHSIQADVVVS